LAATSAELSSVARVHDSAAIMGIERACTRFSYIDVVDRVLDKGIVIDSWMRVSVGGIDLITIEAHLVVASIDTYLTHRPTRDGAGIPKRPFIFDAE
jgi:gas vesicle structural protein